MKKLLFIAFLTTFVNMLADAITWTNIVGCSNSSGNLTKTDTTNWGNGEAFSTETVEINSGYSKKRISTITICDLMNGIIKTISVNEETYKLDLTSYPKGIYIIKVSDSSYTHIQRIIVQ